MKVKITQKTVKAVLKLDQDRNLGLFQSGQDSQRRLMMICKQHGIKFNLETMKPVVPDNLIDADIAAELMEMQTEMEFATLQHRQNRIDAGREICLALAENPDDVPDDVSLEEIDQVIEDFLLRYRRF